GEGAPGRPARQPRCIRRACLPGDAGDVRRSRSPDRHSRARGRAARGDRVAAPARRTARVGGARGVLVYPGRRPGGGAALMHNRWHPGIPPAFTVSPGEELTLECEDGIAGLLTRESTHEDCARLDLGLAHPLTGPVEVTGAEPGDVLEVVFHEYRSADF